MHPILGFGPRGQSDILPRNFCFSLYLSRQTGLGCRLNNAVTDGDFL